MESSVTLATEPVESDQRFVVIRMNIRLERKSDILPSFLSKTNMEECLNCILIFPMSGREYSSSVTHFDRFVLIKML